ncbi:hypothetical protein [Bradyrhizobium zhanjiangense]|uniref:Uncharacterized protein n=1 Tax=Bradyrhizobium zhanjiangense TaxID=1325107 RepID=A0A4Q0QTX8_9BRAD|nr:hypothetical protein EAS61_11190 [Bradyrhizobium zhanjiangense]
MRRRFKQTGTLEQRLLEQAERLRQRAQATPPGVEREGLLRRARQAESASRVNDWLRPRNCGRQPSAEQQFNMVGYRAFIIGEDGHICDARVIEAASDEAAVKAARRFINRHGIEIWQLGRKVAILDADDAAPSAAATLPPAK